MRERVCVCVCGWVGGTIVLDLQGCMHTDLFMYCMYVRSAVFPSGCPDVDVCARPIFSACLHASPPACLPPTATNVVCSFVCGRKQPSAATGGPPTLASYSPASRGSGLGSLAPGASSMTSSRRYVRATNHVHPSCSACSYDHPTREGAVWSVCYVMQKKFAVGVLLAQHRPTLALILASWHSVTHSATACVVPACAPPPIASHTGQRSKNQRLWRLLVRDRIALQQRDLRAYD